MEALLTELQELEAIQETLQQQEALAGQAIETITALINSYPYDSAPDMLHDVRNTMHEYGHAYACAYRGNLDRAHALRVETGEIFKRQSICDS